MVVDRIDPSVAFQDGGDPLNGIAARLDQANFVRPDQGASKITAIKETAGNDCKGTRFRIGAARGAHFQIDSSCTWGNSW